MAGASPAPPRREEVLAIIIDRLVQTGSSPTYDEIAEAMQPRVGRTRIQGLVDELIKRGDVERIAGSHRGLRVRDVVHGRALIDRFVQERGWVVAMPLGDLEQPFKPRPLRGPERPQHRPEAD